MGISADVDALKNLLYANDMMPDYNDESINGRKQQIILKLKVGILDGVNKITFNSHTTTADLLTIRHNIIIAFVYI